MANRFRKCVLMFFLAYFVLSLFACAQDPATIREVTVDDLALVNDFLTSQGKGELSREAAEDILERGGLYAENSSYTEGDYAGENVWISLVRYVRRWKIGTESALDYKVEVDPLYDGLLIVPAE